eukprot:1501006-Amphidinium_carterae.1
MCFVYGHTRDSPTENPRKHLFGDPIARPEQILLLCGTSELEGKIAVAEQLRALGETMITVLVQPCRSRPDKYLDGITFTNRPTNFEPLIVEGKRILLELVSRSRLFNLQNFRRLYLSSACIFRE